MISLNRIFLALCLLSVGQAFSMTREGINARNAELADIEASLRTANPSKKIVLLEKARKAILYLIDATNSYKFKPNALSSTKSPFSFHGISLSGAMPKINGQLKKMLDIIAIEQNNAAKQLETDKQKEYERKMNALVDETTDLAIGYEKELSEKEKQLLELLKKLRRK